MISPFINGYPRPEWQVIKTLDMHTGGEPLRIITEGLPEIPGDTILEKRRFFRENLDAIRRGLMLEPRGHADMYGAVVTPPVTPDGHFGTFFLHNEGYSTMCGHAMIALIKMALETGMVPHTGSEAEVRIDAPPGRITGTGIIQDGKVVESKFRNVPSFVLLSDQKVSVPDLGTISFDVAYGGAFYAFVDSQSVGIKLVPEENGRLIEYGRKIKKAVSEAFPIVHPFEEDLSFLYGTIFTGPAEKKGNHSRNVCIFADGEVDRSPTGSGVSARAALHYLKGDLKLGDAISIESILGTEMTVQAMQTVRFGPYEAVVPQVAGSAFFTGKHEFWFDPTDPLKEGFFLR